MWTASSFKRSRRWGLQRAIFPALTPPAILIFFAASALAISIPSAKAHVEAPAGNAASAKPELLAGSASLSYQSGPDSNGASKRDPFRLPPPPSPGGAKSKLALARGRATIALPPGPAGLLIDQLRLQGTVSADAGHRMIAIVTNDTDVAYFLRPDEAVFDGVVTQITPGAVYFRQRLQDAHGQESFREVVKRLIPRKSQ
ncbi:MAG: hypothetical protein ACRD22_07310 [Terriglobia bacterium]